MKSLSFEARAGRMRLVLALLLVLGCAAAVASMCVGAAGLTAAGVVEALIGGIRCRFTGDKLTSAQMICLNVRLPRVASAYLAGGALAISGCCMQGLFRNPMADSHLLGVSSGASLGVAVSSLLGLAQVSGMNGLFAFAFALLAVALVVVLSRVRGRISTLSLLLAGVAVSSLLSALTSGIMILNREHMDDIFMWTMGSFANSSWQRLTVSAPVILLGSAGICVFSRDLNVMLLGEREAASLGVPVKYVRLILILLTSLITAMAVSVSGVIGFVGLMVPHMMRLLTGPDNRHLLPVSFLSGGLYMLCMDTLARTLIMPLELPVGVLTALVGGPFFLILMRRRTIR